MWARLLRVLLSKSSRGSHRTQLHRALRHSKEGLSKLLRNRDSMDEGRLFGDIDGWKRSRGCWGYEQFSKFGTGDPHYHPNSKK